MPEMTGNQATVDQRGAIVSALRGVLMASRSFRSLVSQLQDSVGGYTTSIVYETSGATLTRVQPKSQGATIFFNPSDQGKIWTGGSGGRHVRGSTTPVTAMAHEFGHAYDGRIGGFLYHHPGSRKDEKLLEMRGVWYENVFRREAGMLSRDCYYLCGNSYPYRK